MTSYWIRSELRIKRCWLLVGALVIIICALVWVQASIPNDALEPTNNPTKCRITCYSGGKLVREWESRECRVTNHGIVADSVWSTCDCFLEPIVENPK